METPEQSARTRYDSEDYGTPIPSQADMHLSALGQESTNPEVLPADDYKPVQFRFLYKTIINIECGGSGENTKEYPVHKEYLCSISEYVNDLCRQGEPVAKAYQEADTLQEQLRDELEVATENFSAEKTFRLLTSCFRSYPLPEYIGAIKKSMSKATNGLLSVYEYSTVANKRGGVTQSAKVPGDQIADTLARARLLRNLGIQKVAGEVFELLERLRSVRETTALNDPVKAAAQNRLILAEYDPITVERFVAWMYTQKLEFSNGTQLCQLYGLAQKIGVTGLAHACLDHIGEAVFRQADKVAKGQSTLFNPDRQSGHNCEDSDPDNALADIFDAILLFVQRLQDPPAVLRQFVEDALSWGGTRQLFEQMASNLSQDMIIRICKNLFDRSHEAESGGGTRVPLMERLQMGYEKTKSEEGMLIAKKEEVTPGPTVISLVEDKTE